MGCKASRLRQHGTPLTGRPMVGPGPALASGLSRTTFHHPTSGPEVPVQRSTDRVSGGTTRANVAQTTAVGRARSVLSPISSDTVGLPWHPDRRVGGHQPVAMRKASRWRRCTPPGERHSPRRWTSGGGCCRRALPPTPSTRARTPKRIPADNPSRQRSHLRHTRRLAPNPEAHRSASPRRREGLWQRLRKNGFPGLGAHWPRGFLSAGPHPDPDRRWPLPLGPRLQVPFRVGR